MTIDTLDRPEFAPRRPVIAQSWRRSALNGIRSGDAAPTTTLDIASADPLLDAARPVLDDAATRLAGAEVSLLLVDHECRLVSRVACSSTVERTLDSLGAAPGIPFDEESVGTTALGTPAEVRGQVTVNGTEHYLDQFKHLSCFGQPIIHPTTRRLAGILCMTEISDRINPLAVPFVGGIVAGIADRLLDRSRAHQRIVLDAFQRAAPRRDVAVAALGDDLQLTNALAAELLSNTDLGMLRALVADPDLRTGTLHLTLSSGTAVEVMVEPVTGTVGAALFWLRPAPRHHAAPAAPARRPSTASIGIVGEPGTGRTTRARESAAAHSDAEPVVVDIADALISGVVPDVITAIGTGRREGRPLILDGVDLLDERSVVLLTKAAESATADHPLIVVSGPVEQSGASLAALLARCSTRIDLPSLRSRPGDLAARATSILRGVDPSLTLSGPATDALLCQEWPGNLTELRSVLTLAAIRCTERASTVVDTVDLPDRYRTTSRAAHLSGREQAERQAIIDALEHNGRNKVHAARELGISRTTLYARIRALGI